MNTFKVPDPIKGEVYFPACKLLPTESEKITVYTPDRGSFTASRNGHDWRVGGVKGDGDAWISFAIKDNDWWKYMDSENGKVNFNDKDKIK